MALLTFIAALAIVDIVDLMTGIACIRGIFIAVTHMTGRAGRLCVATL